MTTNFAGAEASTDGIGAMSDVNEISGFTPGPWRVFDNADHFIIGIGELNGDGITDCGFGIWRGKSEEAHANARLIAAAPNMHAEIANLRRVNAELVEALTIAREHMDQSHVPAMMCVNAALRSATEKKDVPP